MSIYLLIWADGACLLRQRPASGHLEAGQKIASVKQSARWLRLSCEMCGDQGLNKNGALSGAEQGCVGKNLLIRGMSKFRQ